MEKLQGDGAREAIVKAAAGLRGLEHVPAAHADLFERAALAQLGARAKLSPAIYPSPTSETAAQMLRHGFHLVDFARLNLDSTVLETLWLEMTAILADVGELSPAQVARLERAVAGGRLALAELAETVLRGELEVLGKLARRVRLPSRLLAWLTTLSLKPFLGVASEAVAGHLQGLSWPHPYCPVCGHKPLMAITLRANGLRQVECSLCATRWDVRRGRCVFCGNEDKDTYKFLTYDLEAPHRVDVCDKCRHYLKVVDERKMMSDRQLVLPAEDVATLYLDELARQKRYLPPWSEMPRGKTKTKRRTEEVMPA